MSRASLTALVLGSTLFAGSALAAETWSCKYQGKWETTATKETGEFQWSMRWEQTATGWHIVGDYEDKYGKSTFDGNCASKVCNFTQAYGSGSLQGKSYFWTGTYTDTTTKPGETINEFKGSWGTTAENRADGGPWSAKAVCTKQ